MTLAYLLKTQFVIAQLMRNNVGIAYPAIDESCLSSVLLPARQEDLPKLQRQAAEISRNEEQLHNIRKHFKESIENAGAAWRQMNFKPASKLHPANQTTSRRQPRTVDSGSRVPEILELAAVHTA